MDFLSWEGYDIPDPLKAWKSETGVTVKATYIGNHDEIQTKLKAGGAGAGYDIITYYQGYKPLYQELEILEPLDEQKLPNLKNLFPYFAGDEGNFWIDADGTRTGDTVDMGLDRDHDRHAPRQVDAHVLVRPARAGVQGQGGDPGRPDRVVGARVARLRFDPAEDDEGGRREGLRPAVAGGRAVHRASRPRSATRPRR